MGEFGSLWEEGSSPKLNMGQDVEALWRYEGQRGKCGGGEHALGL